MRYVCLILVLVGLVCVDAAASFHFEESSKINTEYRNALRAHDFEKADRLRAEGASFYAYDYWHTTVLHEAAARGDLLLVQYLVEKHWWVDVNVVSDSIEWCSSVLKCALDFGHRQVADYLIEHGAVSNDDAYCAACKVYLREHTLDEDRKKDWFVEDSKNARCMQVMDAIGDNDLEKVQYIVAHGIDLNASCEDEWWPNDLMECALVSPNRNLDIVAYLFENGVDKDRPDILFIATLSGTDEFMAYLINNGANMDYFIELFRPGPRPGAFSSYFKGRYERDFGRLFELADAESLGEEAYVRIISEYSRLAWNDPRDIEEIFICLGHWMPFYFQDIAAVVGFVGGGMFITYYFIVEI